MAEMSKKYTKMGMEENNLKEDEDEEEHRIE